LLVGVLLALLATELLLRIGSAWFFPPLYVLDAALGWRQAAELERTLLDEQGRAIHFATDARGLRATPFPDARTPGRPRVLVVGDSFVQASQVDAAESFVGRLGATLAPAEVWNVGVGGYSTVQELLALPVQLAAWAPDVVLWVVYENDFVDNLMPYFSGLGPRPHAVVDGSDVAIVASPSAEPFLPFLLPLPGALWLYEHCALYRTLHKNLYLPAAGSALAVREQRERSRWPVARGDGCCWRRSPRVRMRSGRLPSRTIGCERGVRRQVFPSSLCWGPWHRRPRPPTSRSTSTSRRRDTRRWPQPWRRGSRNCCPSERWRLDADLVADPERAAVAHASVDAAAALWPQAVAEADPAAVVEQFAGARFAEHVEHHFADAQRAAQGGGQVEAGDQHVGPSRGWIELPAEFGAGGSPGAGIEQRDLAFAGRGMVPIESTTRPRRRLRHGPQRRPGRGPQPERLHPAGGGRPGGLLQPVGHVGPSSRR
jgi:hypothetical protein